MILGEWIKAGAVVIDVGINRIASGALVGDVEFAAAQRAGRRGSRRFPAGSVR